MNERLKELRLTLNLSQEEFGNKLKIKSKAHISSMERGNRNLTSRVISDVCREFNANEEWLRTGNGSMFGTPKTKAEQFEKLIENFSLEDLEKVDEFLGMLIEVKRSVTEIKDQALKGKKPLTKEELEELEIQKELAEFEEAVRGQKNRDALVLKKANSFKNMDCLENKEPA